MTTGEVPLPTPADLAALYKGHQPLPSPRRFDWCHRCGSGWPCPTFRALTALDAARAAVDGFLADASLLEPLDRAQAEELQTLVRKHSRRFAALTPGAVVAARGAGAHEEDPSHA